MKRIFLRETVGEGAYVANEKVKIGVVGICEGAGATFFGVNLAKMLSLEQERPVAFAEIGGDSRIKPLTFDSLGMDKRFAGRSFNDFYGKVRSGENIRGLFNIDEKINWALKLPQSRRGPIELNSYEKIRLINNLSGDIIVCDVHAEEFRGGINDYENLMMDMNIIICVVDPLPSKLLAGYEVINAVKRMENKGVPTTWILNKYCSGINKKELFDYLKVRSYIKIPPIDPSLIYSAEYNCKLPYCEKEIRNVIREPLGEIAILHKIHIGQ